MPPETLMTILISLAVGIIALLGYIINHNSQQKKYGNWEGRVDERLKCIAESLDKFEDNQNVNMGRLMSDINSLKDEMNRFSGKIGEVKFTLKDHENRIQKLEEANKTKE